MLDNSSDMDDIIFDFIFSSDSMNSFEIEAHSITDEEFFILVLKVLVFISEKILDILFLILSIFESSIFILILLGK